MQFLRNNHYEHMHITIPEGLFYTLIPTGAASSPSASQWNMVVANNTDIQGNLTATIPSAFQSTHIVPSTQALIASYPSTTDQATGTNIKVSYNAYIASNQVAGTYEGKVKYTLVHPSNHEAPADRPATLDTGQTVNAKMKSLANNTTKEYTFYDSAIKSIDVHTETVAPSGFTPSEANTISSSTSEHPIYIVFDNTNSAGIMHFYTEGDKIFLPTDSSYMFRMLSELSDYSGIASWDTSNVTNMNEMFYGAGCNTTTAISIDLSNWDTSSVTNMIGTFSGTGANHATSLSLDLSGWDTSNVTNMSNMFAGAGGSATAWSITGLSSWDTSNVTNTSNMFTTAGNNSTTFSLDLSGWNTSNVTNMSGMFASAGYSATTFSLNLSGWNTSSVTDMSGMFYEAGYSATTWSIVGLSSWNTSSVTNMNSMFQNAGRSATTFSLNLSDWNTSSVTAMVGMFQYAGLSATTFSLDLSGWDTSKVTNMINMFLQAGYFATAANWSVIIPQTNGSIKTWRRPMKRLRVAGYRVLGSWHQDVDGLKKIESSELWEEPQKPHEEWFVFATNIPEQTNNLSLHDIELISSSLLDQDQDTSLKIQKFLDDKKAEYDWQENARLLLGLSEKEGSMAEYSAGYILRKKPELIFTPNYLTPDAPHYSYQAERFNAYGKPFILNNIDEENGESPYRRAFVIETILETRQALIINDDGDFIRTCLDWRGANKPVKGNLKDILRVKKIKNLENELRQLEHLLGG